jgi:glyoxylase-like metal-dependent hydrolase (beta-lactamase superfamily II)
MLKTVLAACLFTTVAFAQQQPDFSKVEIKTTRVAGNVYMLEGMGGNMAALTGNDGIVLVDAEYAPLADKIRAALKTVSDKPVKYLINTHWHGDHTNGNTAFGDSAVIIAHDNVRKWLSSEQKSVFGQAIPPIDKNGLPTITYDHGPTLHLNGDDILLYHPANSHTDGDTIVYFSNERVVHMGNNFVNGRFPILDVPHGGSVKGMIAADEMMLAHTPTDTKFIPGHGPLSTRADLEKYVAMLKDTRDTVAAAIQKGRTADQMKQDKILSKYDSLGSPDRYIDFLYADLSRTASGSGQ